MWAIYKLVGNFGWSVVIFTFIFKAATFPLTLKQQKNMAISQLFMPRVKEIQRNYRTNQTKMQEEMAKLQKEGYNPMGGCGSMALLLIITFGLIDVVYKPMTHFEHFDKSDIAIIKQIGMETDYAGAVLSNPADAEIIYSIADNKADKSALITSGTEPKVPDIDNAVSATKITNEQREKLGTFVELNFAELNSKESRISNATQKKIEQVNVYFTKGLQSELFTVKSYEQNPDAFVKSGKIGESTLARLTSLKDNMDFFGIDLGEVPKLGFNRLMLVPVISVVFSLSQMLLMQYINKKTNPDLAAQGGASMKIMLLFQPVFSFIIALQVPAGVGFYWATSYAFGILQSLLIYKFYPPEKMRAEAQEKLKMQTVKYNTTAVVRDVNNAGGVKEKRIADMSGKEQKEYYKKRLEEARKADAERYGEADAEEDFDLDKAIAERIKAEQGEQD
jgi:YidC/Oxa1 family membrane protein insertase